ncbi:MAG: Holliday junction resolvase RuvX [Candidatus Sumerlaeia bacterium]|nr:Holliday junction resolvase RuvX [Candidatus Sumerlaeia bacterium]
MTDAGRGGGALLALDVGDRRIGVAVSESGVIAKPLGAVERTGRKATLDALEALVRQYDVRRAVVGLPLLEGGVAGEQAEKTRAFVRSLQRRLPGLEVVEWDERHTSSEAREILGPGRLEPGRIDSVAAAVILQEYLDQPRG